MTATSEFSEPSDSERSPDAASHPDRVWNISLSPWQTEFRVHALPIASAANRCDAIEEVARLKKWTYLRFGRRVVSCGRLLVDLSLLVAWYMGRFCNTTCQDMKLVHWMAFWISLGNDGQKKCALTRLAKRRRSISSKSRSRVSRRARILEGELLSFEVKARSFDVRSHVFSESKRVCLDLPPLSTPPN